MYIYLPGLAGCLREKLLAFQIHIIKLQKGKMFNERIENADQTPVYFNMLAHSTIIINAVGNKTVHICACSYEK